jgi:hypothetical protein
LAALASQASLAPSCWARGDASAAAAAVVRMLDHREPLMHAHPLTPSPALAAKAKADPGQDPRDALDIASLWSILDLAPGGRGTECYPKLTY